MNYSFEIIDICMKHVSKLMLNRGEYKKKITDQDLKYEQFGTVIYVDDSFSKIFTEEDFYSEIQDNRKNIIESALCYPSYIDGGDWGVKLMKDNGLYAHFVDIPVDLNVISEGFFSKKYEITKLSFSLSKLKLRKGDFNLLGIDDNQLKSEIERAKNGDLDSQYLIGFHYLLGLRGIEKNIEKGFRWLEMAADHSNIHAQYMLGSSYCSETFEYNNIKKGVKLLNESAKNGHLQSQLLLGKLYHEGQLVEPDLTKSEYWLLKASKQNSSIAIHQLGNWYYTGEIGNKDMEKAYGFYLKSANLGNPESQFNISLMYAKGEHVEQDFNASKEWMMKASKKGMAEADYNLFKLYYHDHEGLPKDDKQALYWLRKAGERGHSEAKQYLSKLGE